MPASAKCIEVVQGFPPVMNRHRPLLGRLPQREKQQLQRGFFVGESAVGLYLCMGMTRSSLQVDSLSFHLVQQLPVTSPSPTMDVAFGC